MNAEILVFDGFDELDVVGPLEVLRAAEVAGAAMTVRLVTLAGVTEVTGAHGLEVRVAGRFASGGYPDVLVVPGGGWVLRSSRGARREVERGAVPLAIAEAHRNGTVVASVCTGAMLLAAAGLLHGRPATTHHGAIEDLRCAGAQIVIARVVDTGDVLTAGGITSGLDLALWLVERFAGSEFARRVEHGLEYDRQGEVWRETLHSPPTSPPPAERTVPL